MTDPAAPAAEVMAAFGQGDTPSRMAGGQGGTWRSGSVVLKPGHDPVAATWEAEVFLTIKQEGFRVARPVRARDGRWCIGGWCAWEFLAGAPDKTRWVERVAAAEQFHRALTGIPRPKHLIGGTSPWSVADRVAWEEEEVELSEPFRAPLHRLFAARRPVQLPFQLVHGDLGSENVLFHPGDAPAIIDFSPCWRPAGLALAIATADALAWEGADDSIVSAVEHVPEFHQLLVRAVIFRLVVADLFFAAGERAMLEDLAAYQPVLHLAVAEADGR